VHACPVDGPAEQFLEFDQSMTLVELW
jgi:hypothetical protein